MSIEGIDVSIYQGHVAWPVVAETKSFAFIRHADGEHLDATFERNWKGARDAGIIRGAYQYFRASRSGAQQARSLVAAIGQMEHGMLPPAIDLETLDKRQIHEAVAEIRGWIGVVEDKLGTKPVIYTYPSFWAVGLAGASSLPELGSYPLWIAHYGVAEPAVQRPWTKATFWQYSGHGRCPGIINAEVDLNVFLGAEEQLRAMAGVQGATPNPST